jgi:hypothetical protein
VGHLGFSPKKASAVSKLNSGLSEPPETAVFHSATRMQCGALIRRASLPMTREKLALTQVLFIHRCDILREGGCCVTECSACAAEALMMG